MLVNMLQYLVGDGEAAQESHDTTKHSQEGPSPTISGNLEREQEPHSLSLNVLIARSRRDGLGGCSGSSISISSTTTFSTSSSFFCGSSSSSLVLPSYLHMHKHMNYCTLTL